MRHVFASVFIILAFAPRLSSAQTSLDWQKVQVEQAQNDLKRVTFSGHADPGSQVKVDQEGIIIVSPDPSGVGSDPSFVYPMMYTDYLANRKIELEIVKKPPKEIAVTIRTCDLRGAPDDKSPRKGRVAKGKKLPIKKHSLDWLKFSAKGRTFYMKSSCVAFGPEKLVNRFWVKANAKGEFSIILELPPGILQIPVELVAKSKVKAFVANVEIQSEEETKGAPEQVIENSTPEEVSNSSQRTIHFFTGMDSYSYRQSGDIGSFDFKANALTYGVGFGLDKESYGLQFLYRRFQGDLSSQDPVVISKKRYTLERMRAEFYKRYNDRIWSPAFSLDYVSSPVILAPQGGPSIYNMKSLLVSVGINLDFSRSEKLAHELNLRVKTAVHQEAAGKSAKGFSGYEVGLSYLPQFQISKSLFLGGNLEVLHGSSSAFGVKRSAFDALLGLRVGFDF